MKKEFTLLVCILFFPFSFVCAQTLLQLTPMNNAVDVAAQTNLVLAFQENVKAGEGNITIYQNGQVSRIVPVNTAAVTFSGNKVTVDPPVDFVSGASIAIQLDAGAILTTNNIPYEGISNSTTWNFTVAIPDQAPPVITSLSPPDNATGVAAHVNLEIVFSEDIIKSTGTITIRQGASTQLVSVSDESVTIAGNKITINPPADFPPLASVYVIISEGSFKDKAGNSFIGIADPAEWNFTVFGVFDNTAPTITSFNPTDNGEEVDVQTNLILAFNEAVKKGSGDIVVYGGNTVLQTVSVNSPAVTISDKQVTISLPSALPSGTGIHVQFPEGAFTDIAGNKHKGITDATTWNFTTKDILPPTIVSLSPADNASQVPVNASLTITFNEPIRKGSGTISIYQGNGSVQPIKVSETYVQVAGNKATIELPESFASGATVYIQLSPGLFTDLGNNSFDGIPDATTWNFTVQDILPPLVTLFSPPDNATNVDNQASLIMTFTEEVKKGTGNISILQGGTTQSIPVTGSAVTISGKTVTIKPPANFPSGANIRIIMPAGIFTDLSNNAFAGISDASTWNFSVEDNSSPLVNALYPIHESNDVPPNTNLLLTFNENIKKGSEVIVISYGDVSQRIEVTSRDVNISGNTAIVNPTADFPVGAIVQVQIPSGAFTDLTGNPFAGIADALWSFTVAGLADKTPPVVTDLFPKDDAVNIPANTNLVITFDEKVQRGSGTITIKSGSVSKLLDVEGAEVVVSANKVTINPAAFFSANANVSLQIPEGAFKDLANNPFKGIQYPSTWNFVIAPVTILSHSFPQAIRADEKTIEASVEVTEVPSGVLVELVAKGISKSNWSRTTLSTSTNSFTALLNRTQFDQIGLMYYFDFKFSSGASLSSDTAYTYITYTGTGLAVDNLKSGETVNDYQLISVPLELINKNASAVFEDDFGPYTDTEWRLFSYDRDSLQEYKNGLSIIEPGKGYWLIARDKSSFTTGEGTTPACTPSEHFPIHLKKGWNLIGNPYPFAVAWADVKNYNKNAGIGDLKTFDSGFKNSPELKKFGGGFVFAEEETIIRIPVTRNEALNGRIKAPERHYSNSLWEVNFTLSGKDIANSIAGVGMNKEASYSKDAFDAITVPRFIQYLEMNFEHPEYFAPSFTKDVVPVQENFNWEFTIDSNLPPQQINLDWNCYFAFPLNNKRILLYDLQKNKVIDLTQNSNYSFWLDQSSTFRLYYGTDTYIEEKLSLLQTSLGSLYPNPFSENIYFPFFFQKQKVYTKLS